MALTRERKRYAAAAAAAIEHHRRIEAAREEAARKSVLPKAPVCPAPTGPSAWTFAGRHEMMTQRVRRQMRRL